MENKIYLNAGIALLAGLGLAACNGGSSSSTSNNASQTSELQQYINSLAYTPIKGKQVNAGGAFQQSFTTPGGLTINSVDIKFYSGANCTGTMILNTTLSGGEEGVTPAAGTYSSTNASNNALCTKYDGGCSGLYEAMSAGNMLSMQYTYNLSNGEGGSNPIAGQCMYNQDAQVGETTGVEGIANWVHFSDSSACDGGTCGFSQPYSVSLGGCSSGSCDIFATSTSYGPNLLSAAQTAGATVTTGVAGADYLCQLAANNSESATPGMYKALLGASTRVPPAVDWVLKANYNYVFINYDGTKPSFATNANSIFESFGSGAIPLSFPAFADLVLHPPVVAGDTMVFTGLDNNFTFVPPNTCGDWMGAMCPLPIAGSGWDQAGLNFYDTALFIPQIGSNNARLYCVQQ